MFNNIKVIVIRRVYRFLNARAWRDSAPPGAGTKLSILQLPSPDGQLALRMITSNSGGNKPLIIFFHGGGWVIGDLDTHQPFCQELCRRSGCTVISVDYRLAPEHPFPAAHNDCLFSATWITNRLGELGPNNGTVVLAGDSAGANLAICSALEMGDAERAKVAGEIIIYPVTDHYQTPYPSYTEKAKGYALSTNMMRWFWDTYMGNSGEKLPPRATPLQAMNLSSLPATLLVTAENDPLRDEGIAYGEKLKQANVTIKHLHYAQDQHGFACSEGVTASFEKLMTEICGWLSGLGKA
ncbi:MAG: acetyl esterase [Halioglobus sp.]|jgi:acetyl esterase